MPKKDFSNPSDSKALELLTKSLEEHEKEMDSLIDKLDKIKDDILVGYESLQKKMEIITENTERVEIYFNELRKSLL